MSARRHAAVGVGHDQRGERGGGDLRVLPDRDARASGARVERRRLARCRVDDVPVGRVRVRQRGRDLRVGGAAVLNPVQRSSAERVRRVDAAVSQHDRVEASRAARERQVQRGSLGPVVVAVEDSRRVEAVQRGPSSRVSQVTALLLVVTYSVWKCPVACEAMLTVSAAAAD